jgi:hypothetical protein
MWDRQALQYFSILVEDSGGVRATAKPLNPSCWTGRGTPQAAEGLGL